MALDLPVEHSCSFCAYLEGRRPYTILHRDDTTAVLVTREQRGAVHVLVIPVRHAQTILDVHAHECGALLATVSRAARMVTTAVDAAGVAIWQNNGRPARQTIPHVHFHVAATLPEGGTRWGQVDQLSVEATDAIADRLRPHW